ncbi:lipopolysaccharide biosynthesis glycosyltransferase [Pseudochelatococcus lubricantis]|uniref:Lipopolysaccharide biosynthesis glycosyltransferase n=1 Tax=Pseudochelatococcus lubricantis TaxID=1538102 RepID=A0ABX0V610_9HYPH|nr:glycosyltransferase family 8 protein [Pseudochelatococcus lubricantis]NIJ58566.1 lipopolysaccharide biosynthesis glycosyltransferase [Pseudochelatococcus lubricantis]
MPNKRLICFTPDRNFLPAAVFAAQRLLSHGLAGDIDIAVVCTSQDVDGDGAGHAGGRLQIITNSFQGTGENALAGLPLGRHLTDAAYRRLLLPFVLPAHYERILYLDSDTLVVRPGLGRVFDLDLGGCPFAAALDMIFLKDFEDGPLTAAFRAYRAGLGFAPDTPYFNSGVLLIDRARWREEMLTERAVAFARAHPELCRFQDQSALNAVARGRWAPLSPRFNFMGDFLLLDLMRDIAPVVLHFVNDPKPWQRERWRGPAWMQALYRPDADDSALPAGVPLTPAFQRFRERLLAFLGAQRFIDAAP